MSNTRKIKLTQVPVGVPEQEVDQADFADRLIVMQKNLDEMGYQTTLAFTNDTYTQANLAGRNPETGAIIQFTGLTVLNIVDAEDKVNRLLATYRNLFGHGMTEAWKRIAALSPEERKILIDGLMEMARKDTQEDETEATG